MAEIIAYTLKIDGQKTAIDNQKALLDAIVKTNKALLSPAVKFNSDEYKQLNTILATLKNTQEQIRKESKDLQKALAESAKTPQKSYNDLSNELKKLTAVYKDLSDVARDGLGGKQTLERINQLNDEIKILDKNLKGTAAAADSLNGLKQRASELTEQWSKLNEVTRKGVGGQELKNELDKTNAQIQDLERNLKQANVAADSLEGLKRKASELTTEWTRLNETTRNGIGGQSLKSDLDRTNAQIQDLERNLKQTNVAADSLEGLKRKASDLTKQWTELNESTRNGVGGQALKSELDQTNAQIQDLERNLKQANVAADSLEGLKRKASELTTEWTRLNETTRNGVGGQSLKSDLDRTNAQIQDLERNLKQANVAADSLEGLKRKASELTTEWTRLGEATRNGVGGQALKSELDQTNDQIQDLERNLKQTNVAADSLDGLRLKAKKLTEQFGRLSKETRDGIDGDRLKREFNEVDKEIKEVNLSLRQTKAASGSYRELQARVAALANEYRNLGAASRASFSGKKLEAEISGLNDKIREIDKSIGSYKTSIGKYGDAIIGFGGSLASAGFNLALDAIGERIRDAIRIFSEFSQAQATVSAVSGATGEELQRLAQNAKDVGASTKFTATEVSNLQIAFARLGFAAGQILQATEGTANLAIATGEDIADSAKVIGQNIRAYGLSADKAADIADVLTTAFNTSALTLTTFAEASKLLAPTANSLGVGIEEATAAIGLLADSGLEGTIATQTISSSLIRLSDETKKYAKAAKAAGVEVFDSQGKFVGLTKLVRNLENATKDLNEEEQLAVVGRVVGVQSARNFNLLLNATGKEIDENTGVTARGGEALRLYTKQLEAAGGEAKRTADIVGDTLAQDYLKLNSAIEVLSINFVDFQEQGLRGLTQDLTKVVQYFNDLVEVPLSEALDKERATFQALTQSLQDSNVKGEARVKIIDQLKAGFKEHLGNINLEKASNSELATLLGRVNEEYRQKILYQKAEEGLNKTLQSEQDKINEQVEKTINFYKELNNVRDFFGDQSLSFEQIKENNDNETFGSRVGKGFSNAAELTAVTKLLNAKKALVQADADVAEASKLSVTQQEESSKVIIQVFEQESLLAQEKLADQAQSRLAKLATDVENEEKAAELRQNIIIGLNEGLEKIELETEAKILREKLKNINLTESERRSSLERIAQIEGSLQGIPLDTESNIIKKKLENTELEVKKKEELQKRLAALEEEKLQISYKTEAAIIEQKLKNIDIEETARVALEKRLSELQGSIIAPPIKTGIGDDGEVVTSGGGGKSLKEAKAAAGSIEDLEERISKLKKAINQSGDSNGIATKIKEIVALEEKLEISKNAVEDLKSSLENEGDSVSGIQKKLSRLNEQLTKASDENVIAEKITAIVALEDDLEVAKKKIEDIRFQLSDEGNSIDGLQARISKLNQELGKETDINIITQTIKDSIDLETRLRVAKNRMEDIRKELEKPLEGDFISSILFDEKAASTRQSDSFIPVGKSTPSAPLNTPTLPNDNASTSLLSNFNVQQTKDAANDEIALIELRRQRAIRIIREQGGKESSIKDAIRKVDLQSDLSVLEQKLIAEQEFGAERIKIENEIAAVKAEIAKTEEETLTELQKKVIAGLQTGLQALGEILGSVGQIQQNQAEAAERELERRYDQRIELARQANAEEVRLAEAQGRDTEAIEERLAADIVRLTAEKDAQLEELQKAAFERNKRQQIAQAIIAGALGVVNVLAAPPGLADVLSLGATRAILIGLTVATTALQVAAIASQKFAKGGQVDGPSHAHGGVKARVRSTGQQIELEGQEGIVNKKSMSSNQRVTVSGTPKQVVSAMNALNNNGVNFARGAQFVDGKKQKGINFNELNYAFGGLIGHKYYDHYQAQQNYGNGGLISDRREISSYRLGFNNGYSNLMNTKYFERGGIISSSNIPATVTNGGGQNSIQNNVTVTLSKEDIDTIGEAVFEGTVEGAIMAAQESNRLAERLKSQKNKLTK